MKTTSWNNCCIYFCFGLKRRVPRPYNHVLPHTAQENSASIGQDNTQTDITKATDSGLTDTKPGRRTLRATIKALSKPSPGLSDSGLQERSRGSSLGREARPYAMYGEHHRSTIGLLNAPAIHCDANKENGNTRSGAHGINRQAEESCLTFARNKESGLSDSSNESYGLSSTSKERATSLAQQMCYLPNIQRAKNLQQIVTNTASPTQHVKSKISNYNSGPSKSTLEANCKKMLLRKSLEKISEPHKRAWTVFLECMEFDKNFKYKNSTGDKDTAAKSNAYLQNFKSYLCTYLEQVGSDAIPSNLLDASVVYLRYRSELSPDHSPLKDVDWEEKVKPIFITLSQKLLQLFELPAAGTRMNGAPHQNDVRDKIEACINPYIGEVTALVCVKEESSPQRLRAFVGQNLPEPKESPSSVSAANKKEKRSSERDSFSSRSKSEVEFDAGLLWNEDAAENVDAEETLPQKKVKSLKCKASGLSLRQRAVQE